jgi:radical SAM C-methyltransferase
MANKKIWLVSQGVWDLPTVAIPLALGYMKSTLQADETIAKETDIRIFSFHGRTTPAKMARDLFLDQVPDVLAFSVLGWNFRSFGEIARSFRQLNPDGWTVMGGTHVTGQGKRVFGTFPGVDVVVNGEGELVFRDVIRAYLAGKSRHDLGDIEGVSFRDADDRTQTTKARARIVDLEEIPSPFLTGALPLLDSQGKQLYDMIQMETNRGCPYKCSFCYWGGSIGQKVRKFSRERLRAELDLIAHHKYELLGLCDANVGMLSEDLEFMDDLIAVRRRTGYPQQLHCSYAKNKSKVFFELVQKMKREGFGSSFTIALQTLNENALEWMQRKNMKINEWEGLVDWLLQEDLDCYAELLWGAPGETVETFFEGYDRVSQKVQRINIYPLLLLPNTEYEVNQEKYGLVTIRQGDHDFEYVLAHKTMTIRENERMVQFIYFARVFAEFSVLRHVWTPLRVLLGMTQSQVLLSLEAWFKARTEPLAVMVNSSRPDGAEVVTDDMVAGTVHRLYASKDTGALLALWWQEEVLARASAEQVPFLEDLFRYERMAAPVHAEWPEAATLPTVSVDCQTYFVREGSFDHDIPSALLVMKQHGSCELTRKPTTVAFHYKTGFGRNSDSHEFVLPYHGRTGQQLFSAPLEMTAVEPAPDPSGEPAGAIQRRVNSNARLPVLT